MLDTSCSQVCGFIATIKSTPPRRPRYPACETRTSYQVGRPWMLEGKMFRGLTGTPMRRIDFARSRLALADPDPLTLANLMTNSFVLAIDFDMPVRPVPFPEGIFACPRLRSDNVPHTGRNGDTRPRP